MTPDFDGRNNKYRSKQREQDDAWHETEKLPADECPDDGSKRHDKDKRAVLAQHRKAAVAAVAGKPDQHSREADCQ